jgi:hypothetical protein
MDITAIKAANEKSASHSFGLRGFRALFCSLSILFLFESAPDA